VNLFSSQVSDRPGEWDGPQGGVFHQAGRIMSQIDARVIQRPLKSGDEGPWWPSRVHEGGAALANTQFVSPRGSFVAGQNAAQKIIAEAARYDQTIIAYYRHMEEARYGGEWNTRASRSESRRAFDPQAWTVTPTTRQDWITRDEKGQPQITTRGIWLCANSEYRQVVAQRMAEIAALGAGGGHFDYMHNPPAGCFCDNCRARWTELGMPGNFPTRAGDPNLYDFYSRTVLDYFRFIIGSTRKANPLFVNFMKAASFANPLSRGLRSDNAALADACGLEYAQGVDDRTLQGVLYEGRRRDRKPRQIYNPSRSTKWAMSWGITRDATYGRPPKIAIDESERRSAEQLAVLTAAPLVYGCTSLIPVHMERASGSLEIPNIGRYRQSQQMGTTLAPHIAYARPVRWAGILFPETEMDARGRTQDMRAPGTLTVYREVLSPMYGALEVMLEQGVPHGFLTEVQVAAGGAYLDLFQLVVCPVPRADLLALERSERLPQGFVDQMETGREVIYLDGSVAKGQRWDGQPGQGPKRDELKHDLLETIRQRALPTPLVQVDLPQPADDEIHAVPMRKIGGANPDDLLVMLTRRWDWAHERYGASRDGARPPTATAVDGCVIRLRADVAPKKAYALELRSGRKTALQIDSTANGTTIDVPPFTQVAAIVIDVNGDTP
jgi:hypothetical protein